MREALGRPRNAEDSRLSVNPYPKELLNVVAEVRKNIMRVEPWRSGSFFATAIF